MGLQLQHDLKAGTCLFSMGELGRVLNIPETRLEKAVTAGAIQPLGMVGRNVVVAFSAREICSLSDAFKQQIDRQPVFPEMPSCDPLPEMRGRKPAVIPGTFNA